jgi:DNA sulfur modification protein DndB
MARNSPRQPQPAPTDKVPRSSSKLRFGWHFPAIRGRQARREHFASMLPLHLIPKLFLFNEDELAAEMRAQRLLNKGRVPEIARYMVENTDTYVFSSLTASIDGEIEFEPISESGDGRRVGILHVPMEARFVINDGQHRRAAIEVALRENPALADEHISVVFFHDVGLERCQQIFADLNRHAIRPSTSLGVLYDHRDEDARRTKLAVLRLPLFRDLTELERSTLSARSRKLFTLSALYHATSVLLDRVEELPGEPQRVLAAAFWEEVARHIPEWKLVHEGKLTAAEVRRDLLHSHGVVIQALGHVGNWLLRERRDEWRDLLTPLAAVNWSRSNATLWEGRALAGGRVSKSRANVMLTTNAIKKKLGLPLSPEEKRLENAWRKGTTEDHLGSQT